MKYYAIHLFFQSVRINSFQGSLHSLAEVISRSTGISVYGSDLLRYLYRSNGLSNYCVKVCFANEKISVSIVSVNSNSE